MPSIKALMAVEDGLEAVEIKYSTTIESMTKIDFNPEFPQIMPGFVDLHIHGAAGKDIMEGKESVEQISKSILKNGTTSFLATTVTAPYEELKQVFREIAPLYQSQGPDCSELLGVHLEGPYISDKKLGAQPNHTRKTAIDEIQELHSIVPIKVLTLAPESLQSVETVTNIINLGIKVQIGHTNASYEQVKSVLDQGAISFTHLFNAMSSLHHRSPGAVGAALAHAQYSELIPDLLHVHPGAIKAALRCIPKLYFVTDSTAATSMPDGEYQLGEHMVKKCQNGVRLQNGTLAGSCLTMKQAWENLRSIGLSDRELSSRLSAIPCELLEFQQHGKLEPNYFADFILYSPHENFFQVYKKGKPCD